MIYKKKWKKAVFLLYNRDEMISNTGLLLYSSLTIE